MKKVTFVTLFAPKWGVYSVLLQPTVQHWAPIPTKRVTYLSRGIYPDEYTPHDAVNRLKQPKMSIWGPFSDETRFLYTWKGAPNRFIGTFLVPPVYPPTMLSSSAPQEFFPDWTESSTPAFGLCAEPRGASIVSRHPSAHSTHSLRLEQSLPPSSLSLARVLTSELLATLVERLERGHTMCLLCAYYVRQCTSACDVQ